ncbi:MAG: MCE family protein [Nocardioidaceae bacterium]|nr:MCE family protein [Nocardioidaceae bacterium]MCL2614573.1 MCE family protein [Nocardioidaceae bacterium]
MNRHLRSLVGLLVGALLLTGCGFDVYSLPLPGGASVGSNPLTVTAEFRDVLDLVPQSAVKVDDVTVGKITKVERDGYLAKVTMTIRHDSDLPSNTWANISQTSLLGEKFISLAPPPTGATGHLANNANIPVTRTGRNPEVEEVLGALSMILNGGGIGRLKIVTTELNKTLGGREDAARSVLTQVQQLMRQLDGRKTQIVDAIVAVNRLAVTARQHMHSIDNALAKLPSALNSINSQRADLRRMLTALAHLGNVGVRVIKQVKGSTIDSLRSLDPILYDVASAKQSLIKSLSTILTYPFIDEAVGTDPQVARNLQMGDYVNLSMNIDLDLKTLSVPDVACMALNQLPSNKSLNQLINLPNLCKGVQNVLSQCSLSNTKACAQLPTAVIKSLCNSTPLLQKLPGLCAAAKSSTGSKPSNALTNLLHSLGLARPAPMTPEQQAQQRQTLKFDRTYDVDGLRLLAAPLAAQGGSGS